MNKAFMINNTKYPRTNEKKCETCGQYLWGHYVFNTKEWSHYIKQVEHSHYPRLCFQESDLFYTKGVRIS